MKNGHERFFDRAKWEQRCKDLGLDGPRKLDTPDEQYQFTNKSGEPVGFWNETGGRGFIHAQRDA